MNNYSLVAVLLLALSQELRIAAAGDVGEEEGSPQYIYMERLRKLTRTSPDQLEGGAAAEDAKNPGTLLASSFKDTLNDGQIGGSSSVTLHFTIPQQSTNGIESQEVSRPISKAELWLFPDFSSQVNGHWYELTFGFVFTLEGFNRPVETQVDNILWRSSDECVMVDLTAQTKIIDRKLKKRNLNETFVNVWVTVHHIEEYHGTTPEVQEWQNTCSSLSSRSSNTSFLVVKYFTDEENSSYGQGTKRAVPDDYRWTTGNETEGCSLVEYKVSLQEVFGTWVASPTELVDVGACSGRCDVNKDRDLFSPRAILKARLRNVQSPVSHMPNHNFQVFCTPVTFEPLLLLIHIREANSYALVDYLVKAKTCDCR